MSLIITDEFSHVLDALNAGESMFLTGKAGTGKSTLIRHFLENTDREVVTVAPTGIAALNVDGYTLHRLFSFGPDVTPEWVRSPEYWPGRFAGLLPKLQTLIVDEVSMVRADLFDCMAAALERFGPNPKAQFGGVQVVLVGDLYQLPPVVTEAEVSHFETVYKTPFFFSAEKFSREHFPTSSLTRIFRQGGDPALLEVLNDVRQGDLLDEARAKLNVRTDPEFEPPKDELWLTLTTTNRIAGSRNRKELEALPGDSERFEAEEQGDLDGMDLPAERTLDLKVGAQVMLLNNDSAGRWVNGTLGQVRAIDRSGTDPVVIVETDRGKHVSVGPHTWPVTRPVPGPGGVKHEPVGSFTQLPIKLAWAITIHKSQGQTLERAVVDLTGGTFANGQLYVALSRCTSLAGLVLRRDVRPLDLKTDMRVRRFLVGDGGEGGATGTVAVSALTVGRAGDRYRPRPVELAVVTDEGDELVTLINPTSDLYSAQKEYGITNQHVQLAPLLTEAWPALRPILAGRVPVGIDVDETLGIIDFEMKRGAVVESFPLGVELSQEGVEDGLVAELQAPCALRRARATMKIASLKGLSSGPAAQAEGGSPFGETLPGTGYVLKRPADPGHLLPELFTAFGGAATDSDDAASLAESLRGAFLRVVDVDQKCVDSLRAVEEHYDVEILPANYALQVTEGIGDFLFPGARVCFTGTVQLESGKELSRPEMEEMAVERGLEISNNMTKTKTDALVVAQRGSQSRKAKDAAKWEKPVFSAREFLIWCDHPVLPASD